MKCDSAAALFPNSGNSSLIVGLISLVDQLRVVTFFVMTVTIVLAPLYDSNGVCYTLIKFEEDGKGQRVG